MLKFGQIATDGKNKYFVIGPVVQNNPQLVLDNVNYIGKKNFVIHIKYSGGISRKVFMLLELNKSQKVPKFVSATELKEFMNAIQNKAIKLINPEDENFSKYRLDDEVELDSDENIAFLASIRENAIEAIKKYVLDLQKTINKLSQRKKNHYFSSKQHYEDVKDFLLIVAPYSDLRISEKKIRQDEWRLKIQLGGQ